MIRKNLRWMAAVLLATNLAAVTPGPVFAGPNGKGNGGGTTTTPIKHVVVIFQENVSFDHYFATYPNATNPSVVFTLVIAQSRISAAPATSESTDRMAEKFRLARR